MHLKINMFFILITLFIVNASCTNTKSNSSDDAMNGLVPALFQCFGIILIGYLSGRCKVLTEQQARGLGSYVTKFALPAVFFKVMVTIDFSNVNWYFVVAVSLSKTIIFTLAYVSTILMSRKFNVGLAGLLAMFCSQSNDVALAYPILKALYPDLAMYVYLFAPAQLVLLNPFSYFSLEWHSHSQNAALNANTSMIKRILHVLLRVILNPLFFMTVIGAVFNFILAHQLPPILDGLLTVMGDSFSATALFFLGFFMVDKMGSLTRKSVYIVVLTLMAKLVIMPFVTRETVFQLVRHESANTTLNMSTFGFLYGTSPTAPPVFLFASEYNIFPEAIAAALVIGTFLSAPMLFILARMVTVYVADPSDYDSFLSSTVKDVSIFSILCCLWTAFILLFTKKYKRLPHKFTFCLIICVMLLCMGPFVDKIAGNQINFHESKPATVGQYILFIIFYVGCNASRIWTILIALCMCIQLYKGPSFVEDHAVYFYAFGGCLPILLTSILLLMSKGQNNTEIDPIFQYGSNQMILSLTVLSFSLCSTLALIIIFVRKRNWNTNMTNSTEELIGEPACGQSTECSNMPPHQDSASDSNQQKKLPQRNHYSSISDAVGLSAVPETQEAFGECEFDRHIILCILLMITMFFGCCLCTWRLVNESLSGVYVVLKFLDGVFNFGQGIILFSVFGLDAELIIIPIKQFITRLRRSITEQLSVRGIWSFSTTQQLSSIELFPERATVDACACGQPELSTDAVYDQFMKYHLSKCQTELGHTWTLPDGTLLASVFSEEQLVAWFDKTILYFDIGGEGTHKIAFITLLLNQLKEKNVLVTAYQSESSVSREIIDDGSLPELYRFNV